MPRLSYREDGKYSMVEIARSGPPEDVCEIWCYEDRLGLAVDHRGEGDALELTHRLGEARVETRLISVADGVDIRVEVTGPDAGSVKAVGSLNPCWQLRRSECFGNRGDYVEDFVSRCFVFLEGGLTLLKDTRRVSGTRDRPDDKANLSQPWIQEYFPVWRDHPGQVEGQRGYSPDRPVYPIVGCVSRDGAELVAFAWPETRSLGQVWHDCLHPRPAIVESYDPDSNRTVSRARLYFLPNDERALLEAFGRDFPEWERPGSGSG